VWQAKALAAPALAATRTPIRLSTSELSARAASRWKGLSEQHSLSGYDTLAPQLDALSAGYVLAALKGLGWELTPGQRRRADTVADELKVVPAHRQMFHRALEMLQEDGVLLREGAFWIVPRVPPAGNPVRLSEQLMEQWPLNGAEISMTAAAVRRWPPCSAANRIHRTAFPRGLAARSGSHLSSGAVCARL